MRFDPSVSTWFTVGCVFAFIEAAVDPDGLWWTLLWGAAVAVLLAAVVRSGLRTLAHARGRRRRM